MSTKRVKTVKYTDTVEIPVAKEMLLDKKLLPVEYVASVIRRTKGNTIAKRFSNNLYFDKYIVIVKHTIDWFDIRNYIKDENCSVLLKFILED